MSGSRLSFSGSVSSQLSSYSKHRRYSHQWADYKFASNWDYIWISLAATFTIRNFFSFILIETDSDMPNLIHHILCMLMLGLPLNYAMILLGQYSQLGVIFFKHLSPIGHGLGYAMMLNSILWCCNYSLVTADFIMYLLTCIDTNLQWMHCPPKSADRCWDAASNCTEDCISPEIKSSALVFWLETYMGNIELSPDKLIWDTPIWARVVPLCIVWAVIYIIVSKGMAKYIKMIRFNLCIATIFVLFGIVMSLATEGSTAGVALMFRINLESLVDVGAWSYAVDHVVEGLALARALHITLGSYMPPKMPSDILTIFSVLLNLLGTFLMTMVIHSIIGITQKAAHLKKEDVVFLYYEAAVPYFTVIPEGLGFVGAPQIWTVLYFLASICLLINALTIQIDIIHQSIVSAHSRMQPYRKYLLVAICSISCICAFFCTSRMGYLVSIQIFKIVAEKIRSFTMFIFTVLTFWIYGVQRISDDIHFVQGAQPTKFWKIFWYIAPCILGFNFIYLTFIDVARSIPEIFAVVHYLSMFIQIIPIPLCMIIEIFRHLRVHNLVGLSQPEERWGPPDPKERHLRRLFNPRQEIRSRRRDDTCEHHCLLGSKYLKKVVAEEAKLREELLNGVTEYFPEFEYDLEIHSASDTSL